jgi:hypothetical protein
MKNLMISCPLCKERFDLRTAITPRLRAALVEILELASLERCRIREEVVAELAQSQRLMALEQEKLISDLRASIQELQFKATRGSQQRVGEVLEIEIFDSLKKVFPHDEWTRIGKGRNGADIVQGVRDARTRDAGRILWEVKNTAAWNSKWIGKIRDDAINARAQLCVIVSATSPKDIQNFGELDGVWVSNLNCYSGLGIALRSQLLTCATLREELIGQGRINKIRDYVISAGFKQRVKTIALAATSLEAQVEREKQFLTRHWAERQQLATSVTDNVAALCLGIQGVSQSQPEIVDNHVLLLESGSAPREEHPSDHV